MWSRLLHMHMVLAQKTSPLQRLPNPITHENKFGENLTFQVCVTVVAALLFFSPSRFKPI
jgi:hypothetical protein